MKLDLREKNALSVLRKHAIYQITGRQRKAFRSLWRAAVHSGPFGTRKPKRALMVLNQTLIRRKQLSPKWDGETRWFEALYGFDQF